MQIRYMSLFSDTKNWPRLHIWNWILKVVLLVSIAAVLCYVTNNVYKRFYASSYPGPVYSFESGFNGVTGKVTPCVVQYSNDKPGGGLKNPFLSSGWTISCGSSVFDDTREVVFRYKSLAGRPIYGTDQEVIEAMVKSGDADRLAVKYPEKESRPFVVAMMIGLAVFAGAVMYLIFYHLIYRTILYLVFRFRKSNN